MKITRWTDLREKGHSIRKNDKAVFPNAVALFNSSKKRKTRHECIKLTALVVVIAESKRNH